MCPDKFKDDSTDEGGAQGESGGKSGKIGVRIATLAGDSRDEPKTPAERRHLAVVHESAHADRVRRTLERQKALAAAREAGAGPSSLNQLLDQDRGHHSGGVEREASPYKENPAFAHTQQYSGMEDPPIPGKNNPDLNKEDREKLENRPENKLQHQLTPQYSPKYSPPTLKRY